MQPNNLVSLCKFQSIAIKLFTSLEIDCPHNINGLKNMYILGRLNRQAGFATVYIVQIHGMHRPHSWAVMV